MPTILDRKLFAHINNDDSLEGTRNLEGLPYNVTVGFLQKFIDDNSDFLLHHIQDKQFDSQLKDFNNKLASMLTSFHQFEMIKTQLSSAAIQVSPYGSMEEELSKPLQAATLPLVSRILQLDARKKDSMVMPGGWIGEPSGHAIAYEFQKDSQGNLLFILYNSGAGLKFHKKISGLDKDRFENIKCYSIPKAFVTEDKLKFFIAELIKPQILPTFSNWKTTKEVSYDAKNLYNVIFPKINHLHGVEIEPSSLQSLGVEVTPKSTMSQRTGVCAQKAPQELLKGCLTSSNSAKLTLLCLKIYSIELMLSNPGVRDDKDLILLNLATQNMSRILLKNKNIPKALSDRALLVKEKVAALTTPPHTSITNSRSCTTSLLAIASRAEKSLGKPMQHARCS